MILQAGVCPHCGAKLNIKPDMEVIHCEYCDSDIVIEKNSESINRENAVNNEEYRLNYKKWKKTVTKGCILYSVCVMTFIYNVMNDSDPMAIIAFIAGIFLFMLMPVYFLKKKPVSPVYNEGKVKTIIHLYLMLIGIFLASFTIGAIIAS